MTSRKSIDKERRAVSIELERNKISRTGAVSITLLGHPGVGKTSLINAALGKPFDPSIAPTDATIDYPVFKHAQSPELDIKLIDTSGKEFTKKGPADSRWKDSSCFALVFSCNSKESFATLQSLKDNFLTGITKPIFLICNKTEKTQTRWKVTREQATQLAADWGYLLYWVSAKKGENIRVFDSICDYVLDPNRAELLTPRLRERSASKGGLGGRVSFELSRVTQAISGKKDKATTPRSVTSGEFSRSPEPQTSWPKLGAGDDSSSTTIDAAGSLGTETEDSHEFLDRDVSDATKKKIRAARKKYEKQSCGDGGWDQSVITPIEADNKEKEPKDLKKSDKKKKK